MDEKFKEMLLASEIIRAQCRQTGSIGPHARQMAEMIKYAQEKRLLKGTVFQGTASEELLNHSAEMAACVLEVIHGENIGSVFALSREEKLKIILRAKEKAESDITSAKRRGLL